MSRARENADGARLDAPLASPAFTGTPTGITAAHLTTAAVLPAAVTGGSGLTALGTVTSGTLGSGVTMPADSVIQVVSAVKIDQTTISSTSDWVTTGLTANITPKNTSSKVLILVTGSQYSDVNDQTAGASIFRGSTNLGNANYGLMPTYISWGTGGSEDLQVSCSATYLDSPSSSSAVTYTVYAKTDKNTYRWGGLRTADSTITLLEIAG